MAIVIVDCDPDRRPLLAQCVARANGGVAPQTVDTLPATLDQQTLVICHVGNRQHEHEGGALGRRLSDATAKSRCILAGFTGGNISPHFVRLMPAQGGEFVINDRASSAEVNELFGGDIKRLVDAWSSPSSKVSCEWLAQAWIGYDPALEAILEILSDLLIGDIPPDSVDDVSEHLRTFGILDLDDLLRASVDTRDDAERSPHLVSLRDQLFRSHSQRGRRG